MRNCNKHKEPQHKLGKFHTANINYVILQTSSVAYEPQKSVVVG